MPVKPSKYMIAAVAVASCFAGRPESFAAKPTNCESADPKGALASVAGDFEIMADPQDSAGNLIFISNVASGASTVVAARLSATTGQVTAGTLTTIADKFLGVSSINGFLN